MDLEAAYRSVSFPLYGLRSSWVGDRWVGGWGSDHFSLAHGGPRSPILRVAAFHPDAWHPDDVDIGIGREYVEPPPDATPENWLRLMLEQVAELPWEGVAFPVNGRSVPLKLLKKELGWEARSREKEFCIELHSATTGSFPLEDVVLVMIADAMAYVEGSRQRHGWR